MSRWRRAGNLIRASWERGGVAKVSKDLASYLAWRFAGSPDADTSPDHVAMRLNDLESALGVLLYGESVRSLVVDPATLVSIVLPTRNRKHLLQRATDSVLAQSYSNWELLIVDNSDDPIGGFVDDERVHILRLEGGGAGSARNLGLAKASGDVITFLDDDNEMAPDWLKAVVNGFQSNPAAQVLIGAQIVLPEPGSGRAPTIRYRVDFDWETLTQFNYVDLGMLAHRRQHDLRFDESLPAFLDWDYVVRLTAEHEPLLVPALSGTYHTDATDRISYQDRRFLIEELRSRFASIQGVERSQLAGFTSDDLSAFEHLLTRIRGGLERPCEGVVTDESLFPIGKVFGGDTVRWTLGQPEEAHTYDLAILGPQSASPHPRLSHIGLVVGTQAHTTNYPSRFPALVFNRRVGDQLWVAAPHPFDPEAFLPGAALVKLGDDAPADES